MNANRQNVVRSHKIFTNEFVCTYFCLHFYDAFKKMCGITNAIAIESYNLREAFSYWKQCQRDYIRRFTQLNQ